MRSARLVLSAVVLGAALLVAAVPAAQATDITNPAEHPDPITLTIDGQSYHDGADTLPGYDDYACTPIPNVQYDFADNQIQYYDDQNQLVKTAHWTEWERISSYETWVAQQQGKSPSGSQATGAPGATPTTTTTTSTTTTPAAAAPAATNPATSSPAAKTPSAAVKTGGSATKSKGSRTRTTSAARQTERAATKTKTSTKTRPSSQGTSTAREKAAVHTAGARDRSTGSSTKRAATDRRAAAASTVDDAPSTGTSSPVSPSDASVPGNATNAPQAEQAAPATESPAGTPKFKLVSDKGVGAGAADTRPVGIGILVVVFGVACLAFLFGSARRRHSFGRVAS
jgi:hypothetical protein